MRRGSERSQVGSGKNTRVPDLRKWFGFSVSKFVQDGGGTSGLSVPKGPSLVFLSHVICAFYRVTGVERPGPTTRSPVVGGRRPTRTRIVSSTTPVPQRPRPLGSETSEWRSTRVLRHRRHVFTGRRDRVLTVTFGSVVLTLILAQ